MSLCQKIEECDRKLFLFLNSYHMDWMDQPFYYISGNWIWVPFYLLLISLIIKQFKNKSWLPILAIILAVTLSDQSSTAIKKTIKRLRPTHDATLRKEVHTVNNYVGGDYGFVSSHAANVFCVAVLLSMLLNLSAIKIGILFLWALLVAYSRIYLGVHFPGDIFFGALLGMIIGFIAYLTEKKLEKTLFYKPSLP
jgi:undecaprenyl-diphosphatase